MMRKLNAFIKNLKSLPWLLRTSFLWLPLALSSCSTPAKQYPANETLNQILKPRQGFKTLTNRSCARYEKDDCAEYAVTQYDVQLKEIRQRLRALGFVCKVAGKRYKIEEEMPQLRRDWIEKCGFLKLKKCRRSEWLELSDMDFLKAANARCFSMRVYPFNEM